jgi:hypothetical protein
MEPIFNNIISEVLNRVDLNIDKLQYPDEITIDVIKDILTNLEIDCYKTEGPVNMSEDTEIVTHVLQVYDKEYPFPNGKVNFEEIKSSQKK